MPFSCFNRISVNIGIALFGADCVWVMNTKYMRYLIEVVIFSLTHTVCVD